LSVIRGQLGLAARQARAPQRSARPTKCKIDTGGGGEIYFDGKLIRKNGEFLPKQLQSLNRK